MRLNRRTAIIMTIAALILIFVVALVQISLIRSVSNLELNYEQRELYSLNSAIDEILTELSSTSADWAIWDATYYYVLGQGPNYEAENLGSDSFTNLRLNSMCFINASGDFLYLQFYDTQDESYYNISEKATDELREFLVSLNVSHQEGIMSIDGDVYLFSAREITDTTASINSGSHLFFARKMSFESDRLARHTRASIEIFFADEFSFNASDFIKVSDNAYIKTLSQSDFLSVLVLDDYSGNPAAYIVAHSSRVVNAGFWDYFFKIYILLFLMILAVGFVVFLLMKFFVIDKIKRMRDDLAKMKDGEFKGEIKIDADKEISDLADDFNSLVNLLRNERAELTKKKNEIEIAYAKLSNLDNLKDNFLSNVSHELRTPLTSIKSYIQLIESGAFGKNSSEKRKAMKIISQSTDHLIKLVNDLLETSRYEAGKARLNTSKFFIRQSVKDTISEFNQEIKKANGKITFIVKIKKTLLTADQDKIKQVIRNLISNAIKYRRPDVKLELKIILRRHEKKRGVVLEFIDNGTGISSDNQKHLFNKFYQVDQSMTRKGAGSGIGLYLCKQILLAHGGSISAESEPGKGSTFYVFIPLKSKENIRLP